MQTQKTNNQTTILQRLLGEPTPTKASGLAYSLAAILPSILSVLCMAVFASFGLMEEGYDSQDWYLYFAYILPQIGFALVAWIALRYQKRSVLQTAKNQACKVKYLFMALLLQIGLFSLSELNTLFLQFLQAFGYTPQEMHLPSMDGVGFVGTLIAVALLPAIFEELFFRGIVLEGLKPLGETAAALTCGALFALYHQNPPQTIYQFCCGAAFAFVALRSGSILPTVLAHFINNAVILTLYKCGVQTFPVPVFIVYISVSVLCLIAAAWWIFVQDRKNAAKKQETMGTVKTFFKYAAVGIFVCALTWILMLVTGL